MNDEDYMAEALDLAARGRGYASPNPMVGAIVVNDGRVVGRGYHREAGGAHGEVNALDDAGDAAKGACLYVTLEPCNHTGRTPPCTESILSAGVARVVVAMADPNPRVRGNGAAHLRERGVEVTIGLCEDRAVHLNEAYIKWVRTKRPFVMLKCAATLDGRIATSTGDSKWISGEESRKYVHELRHGVDAIMVGIGTVKKDDPSLTTRREGVRGRDPLRVILDEDLAIPEEAKVLRLDSDSDTFIFSGNGVQERRRRRIERPGVRVLCSDLKGGQIDIDGLMRQLGEADITSLLIEGGSHVFSSALSAGIVDKLILFYAPKILGGDDGIPIFRGTGPTLMSGSIPVKNTRLRRLGEDIMIEGYL